MRTASLQFPFTSLTSTAMAVNFVLLGLFLTLAPLAGAAQTAGAEDKTEKAVAGQHKAALENWKRGLEKDEQPPHLATENLLLYGSVPGKTLQDIGAALEKQLALARKVLGTEKGDRWPGKIAIYLLAERSDVSPFIRRVERRRPDTEELGSFDIQTEEPHVIAGPGRTPSDSTADAQAGEQLAAALLTKKANTELPSWVVVGFGRATVTQAATPAQRAAEHRRALQLVTQKKQTAQNAWSGGLDDSDATVLRGSVIEYLAYSGRTAKFAPFLAALRPSEERPMPTTEMAFTAANMTPDRLHQVWLAWLRTAQ